MVQATLIQVQRRSQAQSMNYSVQVKAIVFRATRSYVQFKAFMVKDTFPCPGAFVHNQKHSYTIRVTYLHTGTITRFENAANGFKALLKASKYSA